MVVIGGTSPIGERLVNRLRGMGHHALSCSPGPEGDELYEAGLTAALDQASVVVDVCGPPSGEGQKDAAHWTRRLLAAEAAAGVEHHVLLSLMGDRPSHDSGYFRACVAQENAVANSSVSYSIARAVQYFEFIRALTALSPQVSPARLSRQLLQPAAVQDVAHALADIAVGPPVCGTVQLAGSDRFGTEAFVRAAIAWQEPDGVALHRGSVIPSRRISEDGGPPSERSVL